MATKPTKELDPKDFPDAYSYMTAKTEQENKELVPVYLPRDNQNNKTDVIVVINGKRWAVARGVQVMVPKMVRDQLEHSEHQANLVSDLLEARAKEMANYGKL